MACRNHPSVEHGLDRCYRCGFEFCEDCRVEFQGHAHCAACKAESVGLLESGKSARPDGGDLPPWERRQELGMTTAFWETIKAVLRDPSAFFRGMDRSVKTWDCLAVPCILQVLASIIAGGVQVLFAGAMTAWLSSMGGMGDQEGALIFPQLFGGVGGACLGVVFAPVTAIMGVFIVSGLMHLFLMMTSKVGEPFHQTMRGYCYAQAPNILAVIPLLGPLVGGLWAIWTSVVMVKEVHRTTWGTAWMSVLWWLVLCCCIGGGAYAALIGTLVAANR